MKGPTSEGYFVVSVEKKNLCKAFSTVPITYKHWMVVVGIVIVIIYLTFGFWGTHAYRFPRSKMWLPSNFLNHVPQGILHKIWCSEYHGLYSLSGWQRILQGSKLKLEPTFMPSWEKLPYASPSCVWYDWKRESMTTYQWLQPTRGTRRLNPGQATLLALPLLVCLTLTALVRTVPLFFLSLISPKASSKQQLGWIG